MYVPFFGCFGAVYFKDSFPPLPLALSTPNRLASLELKYCTHGRLKCLEHDNHNPIKVNQE
jgi:hypothetical protein